MGKWTTLAVEAEKLQKRPTHEVTELTKVGGGGVLSVLSVGDRLVFKSLENSHSGKRPTSELPELTEVPNQRTTPPQAPTVQPSLGKATEARLQPSERPSPDLVRKAKSPATVEAELWRLVNLVADAHGFSPEDRREALEVALRDPDRNRALVCFRALAAECSGTTH